MKSLSRCLAPTILALAMSGAMAAEEYPSADTFIKSLSPVPPVDQVVEGDLDGDGLSDRAILVGVITPRLYILLQTPRHGFRLAVSSKEGSLDERETTEVSIGNGSLWLSVGTENLGMSGYYSTRYQFKRYKGVWRMIGLTYTSGGQDYSGGTPDGGPALSEGTTDINLLTGDIIVTLRHWDQISEDVPRSQHRKAPGGRSCLLTDFDFGVRHCLDGWKTPDGGQVSELPAIEQPR